MKRQAKIERITKETRVFVEINLDGTGNTEITTGIGFLDHMMTAMAFHGNLDLKLTANGDLHVDAHHVMEDVALTLGQAFAMALGEKKGIHRIAHSWVPMDDALAFVTVDLSGRPYAILHANWHGPYLGNPQACLIPVTLIEHFLRSFATTGGITIHARIPEGKDDHHQAEALFKALGRALDHASRLDPKRSPRVIPSTKGVLE